MDISSRSGDEDACRRVLIMGAGGRDFHVFNTQYRDDAAHEVVAFTAAQIPHIDCRVYPPVLAGTRYPRGIPIRPEAELEALIEEHGVEEVVFAYSDVSLLELATVARRVEAAGARFLPFEPERGLLPAGRPCVAVCAVRTGCGKSPLSRYLCGALRALGLRPAVVRHPMPYGNLTAQVVQRFATERDLAEAGCTIEEREEYEPHLAAGDVVFAGADYVRVVGAAAAEGDVLVWDGGNNDAPFVRPDLLITLLDPLRPEDELNYFPGRWNFERADVLVIGKIDQAHSADVEILRRNIAAHNPEAAVIEGRLPIEVDREEMLRGRRVLVVEDGPTTTHGGMGYGAGYLAARRAGAAEIVDPRGEAAGEIADAFREFPHLSNVLPALGYAERQLRDLETTIARIDCDAVVVGTPIDLAKIIRIEQPTVRVTYRFEEAGPPRLPELLRRKFAPA